MVQDGTLDSWKVLPADGEYCLRLAASDKSGNKSETKLGLRIDTHPPAAPQLMGKIDNKIDAAVSWTKNTEPDLAGYKIYVGTASGIYTFPGSPFIAGKVTSYTVSNLPKINTYFFAMSAYDNAGNESPLSAEVSKSLF
jgi:hypothetical protein